MTAKRFNISIDNKNGVGLYDGDIRLLYFQFSNIEDATSCEDALIHQCSLMNELHEENQYLKSLQWYQDCINEISIGMQQRQLLEEENEQLKKELFELKKDYTLKPKKAKRDYTSMELYMTEHCNDYGLNCFNCPFWNKYSNYCTKFKIKIWSDSE